MRIHRIITSYMYLSTALILPRKIGNCLHLEGKSAWGSPRSWDWLNQRERGKKFSFINRKQNYLEQESTNFSINAIVSTLSLQAIWSLLQLHNLMGESSQKQYGNTWVCLCSNKALFTQTGNRLWPTKMSCDLPTLNLECCFPLLNDVLWIYLYISNHYMGQEQQWWLKFIEHLLLIEHICKYSLLGLQKLTIQSFLSLLTPLI